jgi:hypothetical protein
MLRRVVLVRTDVSAELSASIIRVTRIGEPGTTLAVTNNRRTLRRNAKYYIVLYFYFFAACVGCYLRLTLFLVQLFLSPWWWRRWVPPKRRFLQEPHGVTCQKTPLFNPTASSHVVLTYKFLFSYSSAFRMPHLIVPRMKRWWSMWCGRQQQGHIQNPTSLFLYFDDTDLPSGIEICNPPRDQLTHRRLDAVKSAWQTSRVISDAI